MAENLTPKHLRCSLGGCHSIYRVKDGRLLIRGNRSALKSTSLLREGEDVVGVITDLSQVVLAEEVSIVISPDLLADYIAETVAAERERCAKIAEQDNSFMMLQDFGLQSAVSQKGINIAAAIRNQEESE